VSLNLSLCTVGTSCMTYNIKW